MKKERLLYEMMWYIQNKKNFTAQELADRFQLSRRSIYRYITDLADLGLYVESQKGRSGGFTVLANQVLPPVLFTEKEITALYFAIQSLTHYASFPFQIDTVTAGEKLLAVLPQKLQAALQHLEDHFTLTTPTQVVKTPFLNALMAAALNRQKIAVTYHSAKYHSKKILDPVGVYASNGFWYLFAVDTGLAEPEARHYRVDRMEQVTPLAETSETTLTLAALTQEFVPNDPLNMVIKLTPAGVKQCLENRFLAKDIKQTATGGLLKQAVPRKDLAYTANYLLLLGKEATVVEPPELLDCLKEKITALYETHFPQ